MSLEQRSHEFFDHFDRSQGGNAPGGQPCSPDVRSGDTGIRLVSSNNAIHIEGVRFSNVFVNNWVNPDSILPELRPLGENYRFAQFRTEARRVEDFGDILLSGERDGIGGMTEQSTLKRINFGLAIRNGSVEGGKYQELLLRDENLFLMCVQVRPGVRIPDGYELFCRMRIDGIDTMYETTVNKAYIFESDELDPSLTEDDWKSNDPADPHLYTLLVPADATVLNGLSFSFVFRPQSER